MKINKYIQQTFLLTPLKVVQSASWAMLAVVLAFPSFLTNRNYSTFFLKKAVAVWSKNETTSTAKADQIGRTAFSAEKTLEEILNEWVEEKEEEKPARTEIKNILMDFDRKAKNLLQRALSLICPMNTTLNLCNFNVSSLPDIFHLEPFRSRFTTLYLSDNQLTELPASLGNLQALTWLHVSNNQLTELPASLGNLQALTWLDVKFNQLRELPASLGNLQALIRLDVSDNQLTELPASLGNLQALIRLDVSDNQLTELPASLGNLQALTWLDVKFNQLRELPASLGNLQALTWLNVRYNHRLSGFPMQMLNLPSTCEIDFMCCNFSQALTSRISETMNVSGYLGPQISYSIVDRNSTEEKSIQSSLTELYKVINKIPPEFSRGFCNIEETAELKSWLNRLSDTADYQKGGDLQKTIANKIIGYLNQANENEEFREIFCNTIQGASRTCGDRVALSLLHLGIAYRLSTIDLKNMKELADFFKGVWAINMLEKIARDKIPDLRFFDEIEVYLGYPIKLKKELNLPIDIQEMLYFGCSALKSGDLKEAKDFILKKQANEVAHFKFLITQPKWIEALSANYKEEYKALLEKRSEAAEADNPDYALIGEDFNQGLIELTKTALR